MLLLEIAPPAFDVELDIAYATSANIAGRPIYRRAACFLNAEAADLLGRAIALARPLGYRFRIFDGFRPTEAAWAFWALNPDPTYFADPRKGSPHSRGAAVDLTLVDAGGQALDMGTPFDTLSPLSHHGCLDLPAAAQRNRAILLGLMTAAGWDCYLNEWWHYQLFQPKRFPLLSDSAAGTRLMG